MRVAQGWRILRVRSALLSLLRFLLIPRAWQLLIALMVLAAPFAQADVQYVYDAAGRLVQVVAADGSSALYNYDAAGNITSIQRLAASDLSLSAFNPLSGVPGSQVTLKGTGFASTPGSNAVTFSGAAATVVSASANQLVVTVPAAATTGAISITVGSNTVTSSRSFTVQSPPTISGFSPGVVNAGATVTVSGANLEPVSQATQVTVGPTAVARLSLSATQLTLRAPGTSGHIAVTTPFGSVTAANPLIVAPSTVGAANVVSSATLVMGGGTQSLNIAQQSKYGVFAFDGAQGQLLSIQVSSLVTTPSNATLTYQVFAPNSSVIASGSINASTQSIHLPQLASTGVYLMAVASGSATAQLSAVLEANGILNGSGASLTGVATTSGGQSKRMWISASAGQHVGVGLTNLTMSGAGSITLALYQPNGTYIFGRTCNTSDPGSSCGLQFTDLPVTGNYQLTAVANGTATMSFNVYVSAPITGAMTPGTPVNLNMAIPGQFTLLNFTVTQGQTVALNLGSVATTPGGVNTYMVVQNASGATIAGPTTSVGTTYNLTNLTAGTYRVFLVPYFGITATAQLTLANGLTGTLQPDGTTSGTLSSTLPGQVGYFSIPATAGEHIGVALRNLVLTPNVGSINLSLYQPNGTYIWGRNCNVSDAVSSCGLQFTDLPVTGNYQLIATPNGSATMSFNLTVSQPITGTLTPGMPVSLNMAIPGQFSLLTFTATQGQTLALNLGSIATTPAGVNMYLVVTNASGATVAGPTSTTTGAIYNLRNLAAGTYRVFLVPYFGITATSQLTLAAGATGTLPIDGSTSSFSTSLPGQNAYFTIAATAGQSIGIGLRNLALTPSSVGTISLDFYQPNGTWIWGRSCNVSDPLASCGLQFTNLPVTGNYTLIATPSGSATMSGNLTVTQPLTATLTSGTPINVSTSLSGQFVDVSFTATSGQSATLTFSSIATTPSNVMLFVAVNAPNGSSIGSQSSATGMTFNFSNLAAGTYHVLVIPYFAVTGSAQVSLTLTP